MDYPIILDVEGTEEYEFDISSTDDYEFGVSSHTIVNVIEGGSYELPPATTSTLGGIIVGEDLSITPEGRLSVDKATSVEGDNTKPITAAAVYTEIGNINVLLSTI